MQAETSEKNESGVTIYKRYLEGEGAEERERRASKGRRGEGKRRRGERREGQVARDRRGRATKMMQKLILRSA